MSIPRLFRRALILEIITVAYNSVEAMVSIGFGMAADSIALVGFGLDSIVESLSGLVLIWRLRQHGRLSEAQEKRVEKKATRFVAVTFFILGAYVLIQSLRKWILAEIPQPSLPGIVIASVSIILMPVLTLLKYRTGRHIGSRALMADAKETLACGFLSVALFLGLGFHYWFGFWQADPLAGLLIVVFLIREGREAWEDAEEE